MFTLRLPWETAHTSAEMKDAIANFQSVYKRQKRVFTDRSSDQSDVSCHTVGRDPQRQPSVGIDTPSYHTEMETPSCGQGNLSAPHSPCGGSKYAPRESVDRRENPPAVMVVVERTGSAQPGLQEKGDRYERVLTVLGEDGEHEYNRQLDF